MNLSCVPLRESPTKLFSCVLYWFSMYSCLWMLLLLLFNCQVMSNSLQPYGLYLPVPHHLLEFAPVLSIESVMPSNHLILCHPLLLLPSIFPSIRVFSNESALWIRWPKYWSFSISPSNEYSGLISFRIHWFDLLAVQAPLMPWIRLMVMHVLYIFLSLCPCYASCCTTVKGALNSNRLCSKTNCAIY